MTDKYLALSYRTLLANLTGDRSRLMEMNYALKKEHIPTDLPFERAYMDCLWTIHMHSGAPNRENLIMALGLKYPNLKDIPEQVDALIADRTESGSVNLMSSLIAQTLNQQNLEASIQEALRIAREPIGGPDERFVRAIQLITDSMLQRSSSRPISGLERLDQYMDVLRKRRERYTKGLALGPMLPVKGLRELIPVLTPGELCLWTGPTGGGKSTISTAIAEYNAWGDMDKEVEEFSGGIPVLMIHLETSHNSFQERQLARHLNIPTKFSKTAGLDPDTEPWKSRLLSFRQQIEQWETERAPITYFHAPDASNQEIEKAVYLFSEMCKANDQPGEILVDYLQKMRDTPGLQKNESIAQNAEFLKSLAERYEIHITTFSQENSEGKVFGSSQPQHKSQVHIQIEREDATEDHVRMKPGNQPMLDALGQPRYWHKKGQKQAKTIFRVVKANDDSPGEVTVWIEGALYKIIEG